MHDPPILSVVVPTHNTRELTLACLDSLAGAGPPSHQLVVVDDGGSDGTAEAVASRFPDAQLLRRTTAGGFAAAANQGAAQASGTILLILNSDTELAAGSVGKLVDAFAARERLGIAGAELVYPDGSPQWSGGRWPSTLWLFAMASGLPRLLGRIPGYRVLKPVGVTQRSTPDWVCGAALAVRRQTWLEVGPFDERYAFYCQDLDLCRAASDAGWVVDFAPGFRVLHHHGATISASGHAVAEANPSLLWPDLVRWVRKHEGPSAARRARRIMLAAVRIRQASRGAMAPLALLGGGRAAWRKSNAAIREAAAALAGMDAG